MPGSSETSEIEELIEKLGQKQIASPTIEVIEGGRRVPNPRIDPSVMTFILQASQLAQITRIRKYFEDRTPHGLIQTWGMDSNNPLTVTDELKEIKFDYPAQSLSLINDGDYTVYVWVNSLIRPKSAVKSGETFNLDFELHKINYLYLQCEQGESTSVRIVGHD
jgi:hypothetical protein